MNPLTDRIAKGAEGGLEFERLMHQLLFRHADKNHFAYEPRSGAGGDGGFDGLAPEGGVEGIRGEQVGFQFKWLWDDIHKGDSAQQIKAWLKRVEEVKELRHWILVTPWDLKPAEREWLSALPTREDLKIHHWGRERIENLMRDVPALLARYFPQEAHQQAAALGLGRYTGFDFSKFANEYRNKVVEVWQDVRTLGLPPEALREGDARRSRRLRDVFVPLSLLPEGGGDRRQSLHEPLHAGSSLVVLGDPGTGKTTLLSFLALLHAGGAELEGFAPPSKRVPLLISLRDFVRLQGEDSNLTFVEFLASRAKTDFTIPHAHAAFFESTLRMGEAIVLFDGLDEVGNAVTRRRLAMMIRTFRGTYTDCPCWITSRIFGYTGDVRLPEESFAQVRLGPLDEQQIDDFITRWYDPFPNKRERDEQVASLRSAVRHTPGVRRLAGNPLLLTLMAFIHQGLRRLPQDRGELYEKCIEMLLKTWQEAKGQASAHSFEQLPLSQRIDLQKDYLAHLALHVQERNAKGEDEEARGLFPRREALDRLVARHLEILRRIEPGMTAEQARVEMGVFLDYISDRTGLLIDRGGEQLSFIHLSFQEYLAAWVFICQENGASPSFFKRYLGDPAWEEVILLRFYVVARTSGGGGALVFDRIVKSLLRRLRLSQWQWWRRGANDAGWLALLRALRDNLDFAPADEYIILNSGIDRWTKEPRFDGEWFRAFESICLFGSHAHGRLQETLLTRLSEGTSKAATAACHLLRKLFGPTKEIASQLRRRADLADLAGDLTLFIDNQDVASLVDEVGTIRSWYSVLRTVDSPELYDLTLSWGIAERLPSSSRLRAAIALLWGKVLVDLRSRSTFAGRLMFSEPINKSLLEIAGNVSSKGRYYQVFLPLSGVLAELIELPASGEDFFNGEGSLLIPALAQERLEVMTGSYGVVDSAAANWWRVFIERSLAPFDTVEEISPDLDRYAHDLSRYLSRYFAQYLSQYMSSHLFRELSRDLARYFSRYFGRNLSGDLSQNMARYFSRDLPRNLIRNMSRDLSRNLTRAMSGDMVRYFARGLSRDLALDFPKYLARDFGVDLDLPGIEAQWRQALGYDGSLERLFDDWRFWRVAGGAVDVEEECNSRQALTVRLENPVVLPLLIGELWGIATINLFHALGRSLAASFPDEEVANDSIDNWLRHYPLNVYSTAFAWEERARLYRDCHKRLAGPHGALMLSHGAFAALMTGFVFDGPIWTELLETRDREDPLIEMSYLFHELGHFRGGEETGRKLCDLIRSRPEECREILDAAGISAP